MKNEEEFLIECSDEESYGGPSKGMWHPPVEEIIKLYDVMSKEGVIELSWKSPGRREPTPPPEKEDSWQDKTSKDDDLDQTPTAFDFDDMGESTGSSKITPRRTPGSRKLLGSGQKKVASFKNVMSDIRRQMKLERMDKNATKPAKEKKGAKSSNR